MTGKVLDFDSLTDDERIVLNALKNDRDFYHLRKYFDDDRLRITYALLIAIDNIPNVIPCVLDDRDIKWIKRNVKLDTAKREILQELISLPILETIILDGYYKKN